MHKQAFSLTCCGTEMPKVPMTIYLNSYWLEQLGCTIKEHMKFAFTSNTIFVVSYVVVFDRSYSFILLDASYWLGQLIMQLIIVQLVGSV